MVQKVKECAIVGEWPLENRGLIRMGGQWGGVGVNRMYCMHSWNDQRVNLTNQSIKIFKNKKSGEREGVGGLGGGEGGKAVVGIYCMGGRWI